MEANQCNLLDKFIGASSEVILQIPIYQRKYSWEKQNCDRLLCDIKNLIENKEQEYYFLGSIMYISKSKFGLIRNVIIDGQQRLTTIMLLLKVLIDVENELIASNLEKLKALVDSDKKGVISDIVKSFVIGKDNESIFDEIQKLELSPDKDSRAVKFIRENFDDDLLIGAQINNKYIFNPYRKKDDEKIKLHLTEIDNEQFFLLIDPNNNRQYKKDEKNSINKNYDFLKKNINEWIKDNIKPIDILEAIQKLKIVRIELDERNDDPQAIFETLNSTGLVLSKADLIRNFLLMNIKDDPQEQERVYKNYWMVIESKLKDHINHFLYSYVIYKTNSIKRQDNLYQDFVNIYKRDKKDKKDNFSTEAYLEELSYFADIYVEFINPKNYNKDICQSLKGIYHLNQTTSYPFLLHLFDDYKKGKIDEDTLTKSVKLVLSYIFRRLVCNIPSNSLRGIFSTLHDAIKSSDSLYDSMYKNLVIDSPKTRKDLPSDDTFSNFLIKSNLYKKPYLCRFILASIENGNSKETINIDENITIEHIMPQKLPDKGEWKNINQDDHCKYVHTLGNLTLTGYNSALGQKDFKDKKALIEKKSKAKILNDDVLKTEKWDIEEIKKRGQRLANIILEQFSLGNPDCNDSEQPDSNESKEDIITLSLEDAYTSNIIAKDIHSYSIFGKLYYKEFAIDIFRDIICILDQKRPEILEDYIKAEKPLLQNFSVFSYQNENDNFIRCIKIREGVYLHQLHGLDTKSIIMAIKNILNIYDIPQTEFIIYAYKK